MSEISDDCPWNATALAEILDQRLKQFPPGRKNEAAAWLHRTILVLYPSSRYAARYGKAERRGSGFERNGSGFPISSRIGQIYCRR